MLASSIPPKFPVAFGAGAGGGFIRSIPTASQIGINAGFASLTDGFPPLNFQPVAAGGIPPFGQDFNGLLNQVTKWNQWQSAGGAISFDGAFAAAIGGYPLGAVLASTVVLGNYWLSTVDNNLTDPDSSSAANWVNPPGLLGTGALSYTVISSATAPFGWVFAVGTRTIGSAASGATYAAANAVFLYTMMWNAFSNSICPVTGGRGANAAADFAANKPLQTLNLAGMSVIGQDAGTGRLSGVPVVNGSANILGSTIGENLHTLTLAELAANITSAGVNSISVRGNSDDALWDRGIAAGTTGGGVFPLNSVVAQAFVGTTSTGNNSIGVTSNNTGGGAHNNTSLKTVANWLFKL